MVTCISGAAVVNLHEAWIITTSAEQKSLLRFIVSSVSSFHSRPLGVLFDNGITPECRCDAAYMYSASLPPFGRYVFILCLDAIVRTARNGNPEFVRCSSIRSLSLSDDERSPLW
jgi:hypothetical protein